MLKHILAGTAIALAASATLAPMASASPDDDPYGWNAYRDVTSNFIAPDGPGAFAENGWRPLVFSPYGTTRKIECRGDGHYVQIHDCRQYDTGNTPHNLVSLPNPFRPIYIYN